MRLRWVKTLRRLGAWTFVSLLLMTMGLSVIPTTPSSAPSSSTPPSGGLSTEVFGPSFGNSVGACGSVDSTFQLMLGLSNGSSVYVATTSWSTIGTYSAVSVSGDSIGLHYTLRYSHIFDFGNHETFLHYQYVDIWTSNETNTSATDTVDFTNPDGFGTVSVLVSGIRYGLYESSLTGTTTSTENPMVATGTAAYPNELLAGEAFVYGDWQSPEPGDTSVDTNSSDSTIGGVNYCQYSVAANIESNSTIWMYNKYLTSTGSASSSVTVTYPDPAFYTTDFGIYEGVLFHYVCYGGCNPPAPISLQSYFPYQTYNSTETVGIIIQPPFLLSTACSLSGDCAAPSYGNIFNLVNITLYYGTSPTALTSTASWKTTPNYPTLAAPNNPYIIVFIAGLSYDTTYYFEGTDWNATAESLPSNNLTVLTPSPIPTGCTPNPNSCPPTTSGPLTPPTNVHVYEQGANWSIVNWTNPSVPLAGDAEFLALYVDGDCVGWGQVNVTGVVQSYNYTGLSLTSTGYCVAVIDFNITAYSSLSDYALVLPLAPYDLTVLGQTTTTVTIAWANVPAQTVANVTVFYGTTAGEWTVVDVGSEVDLFTVGLLSSGTTYTFTVADWIGSPATETNQAFPYVSDTTLGVTTSGGGGGGGGGGGSPPGGGGLPPPATVITQNAFAGFPWWIIGLIILMVGVILLILKYYGSGTALAMVGGLIVVLSIP
jgi:hypothetical protein